MDVDLHLFDEDGDMLLLLAQSVPMIQSNNDIDKLVESEEVPFNVHLQVSSKHMILASSVFKAMLQRNGFKEGCTLASTGAMEVPLPDDRPEAFITILDIIHGRTRKVPRKIELDMLTKIAVLVDKYSFHEAVEMFSDMWVARLDPPWKKGRDGEKLDIFPDLIETDILCSWLTISWVFGKADLFREATKYAQLYTTNTFGDPGHFDLPFPDPAIESIKSSRAQCLQAMYDIVDRYIRIYQDKSTLQCTQGPIEARWACNAWLSEALIEECINRSLWPARDPSTDERTCYQVLDAAYAVKLRTPCAPANAIQTYSAHGVKDAICLEISFWYEQFSGLDMDDFRSSISHR